MYYEPRKKDHGLPHDPLHAIVAPRPVGWISSLSQTGVANLAPYSYFNLVSHHPPVVIYSSEGPKDSVVNVEATKEFVCNLATLDLLEQMSLTSAPLPIGESEFDFAKLGRAESKMVKVPRVAEALCALECKYIETIRIKDHTGKPTSRLMVMGEVVCVYINEKAIIDGQVRADVMQNLGRCGYGGDYSAVDKFYIQNRPKYERAAE